MKLFVIFCTLLFVIDSAIIYYISDQGDDYLGLSLHIAEQLDNRMFVRVILLNGYGAEGDLVDVFSKKAPCPLHNLPSKFWNSNSEYNAHQSSLDSNGYHTLDISADDISTSLNIEFMGAMDALGIPECKTQYASYSCYEILTLNTQLLVGSNGFPGEMLTQSFYNTIYINEKMFPGSVHVCTGTPRDCLNPDGSGAPDPLHVSCWYAARQLYADRPKGINNIGWKFQFFLADFPLLSNTTTLGDTLSPEEAEEKFVKKFGSAAGLTNIVNYNSYLTIKSKSGDAYKKWDPNNKRYALGLHYKPYQFASAEDNPNVYMEFITNYTQAELQQKWCSANQANVPTITAAVSSSIPLPTLPTYAIVLIVWAGIAFLIIICRFTIFCVTNRKDIKMDRETFI